MSLQGPGELEQPRPNPTGQQEADRLADAIRQGAPARPKPAAAPPKKGKPGRPPHRPAAPRAEPRLDAPPDLVSPAEHALAVEQLQQISQSLADVRGKRLVAGTEPDARTPEERLADAYTMSPELAEVAADAWSLTWRRYLPAAEERPELRLAVLLIPWLFGIVRAEYAYYAARRPATGGPAPGVERGDLRPQGQRENDAHPGFSTAPFPGFHR